MINVLLRPAAELSHQVHTIAGSMAATKKAKRAEAHLDVYILSITELIWRSTAYPGIKGTLPSARMHFSAACIYRHVFVFGGLEASALRYRPAEKDGQTSVYVLDMSTMQWRVATATNSHDHLKEPIRIAQADVIRAVRRCDEEKLRGLSLGGVRGSEEQHIPRAGLLTTVTSSSYCRRCTERQDDRAGGGAVRAGGVPVASVGAAQGAGRAQRGAACEVGGLAARPRPEAHIYWVRHRNPNPNPKPVPL